MGKIILTEEMLSEFAFYYRTYIENSKVTNKQAMTFEQYVEYRLDLINKSIEGDVFNAKEVEAKA